MKSHTYSYHGSAYQVYKLFSDERLPFLLESSLLHPELGRYSFIGCDPFTIFRSDEASALEDLRESFRKVFFHSSKTVDALPPFTAGAVGYISYDYGLKQEGLCSQRPGIALPECYFAFYDATICIDHLLKTLTVFSSGFPETSVAKCSMRAEKRLTAICEKLGRLPQGQESDDELTRPIAYRKLEFVARPQVSKQNYVQAVSQAIDYIQRGEIYQVNLSQPFEYVGGNDREDLNAADIYGQLRHLSPSCFSGLLDGGDFQVICSSPERFLKLKGRQLLTRPMKGTRPRGESGQRDQELKQELWQSQKEQAELLMITDLERNDLGRICQAGSVSVPSLRTLESYRTVYQTTASVKGRLQQGLDAFAALRSCSPGGSVTGCPKIRAMQIIDELESYRRSAYTGSLGYINFNGDMDFNIMIRTMLKQGQKISFHVGSGIVADSDPQKEYEETLVKSAAMQMALANILAETKGCSV